MNKSVQEQMMDQIAPRKARLISEVGWQWMVGIANMLLILALFVLAVVKAPSSARSNNTRCLQQVSNEEHVSLEAFFQNPMEQDAMVQAMEVCAR